MSLLGTAALAGVSYGAYRAIPTATGFTHNFGLGVALIPVVVVLGAFLFIVSGYTVDAHQLSVERLITTTHIPLSGLTRVWADPAVCKGSLRVFGNGGLYSFSGWFRNKRLGRYRLFATDFKSAVVLQFKDRVVVVSPAVPSVFVEHLRRVIPGLQ